MSMEIEEVGEERVVATAQHIVESLGGSEKETKDMLKILSNFDSRLTFMSPTGKGRTILFSDSLSAAENLISRWDINATNKILFQSGAEEVRTYMDTVDNVQRLMQNLSAGGSASAELIRAQRLMKMSMARLEKEFYKILLSNSEAIDPERWSSSNWPSLYSSTEDSVGSSIRSSDNEDGSCHFTDNSSSTDRFCEYDTVPLDAVAHLRSIAELMARTGYGRECVRVFVLNRKSVVEESLYNLGVEKVKLSDVRKAKWTLLDEKIKKWIYAAKISVRVVFARKDKYPGCAHFAIKGGRRLSETEYQLPIVALVCNFPSPARSSLAMLNHWELETLFHEFGHAIHSLLSRTDYQHFSGTRTVIDFAETPANLFEYFAWDYRVLKQFAKHYSTGDAIPEELVLSMNKARKMFAATDLQRQIFFSMIDQTLFGEQPLHGRDTMSIVADLKEKYTSWKHVEGTHWHTRFNHLVNYGAGYYSYLYAKCFAASLWQKVCLEDPLSLETGSILRNDFIKYGGAKDPSILLRDCLGERVLKSCPGGGVMPNKDDLLQELNL